MKRIAKEELPETLTEDVINILVEMAMEDPKLTFDWADVSDILEARGQLKTILEKVRVVKKAIEQAKQDAKSDKQKQRENEEWQAFVENADPNGFYGNMGQPETPQEYKNRYGVWPPGYDNSGTKN